MSADQQQAAEVFVTYAGAYAAVLLVVAAGIAKALGRWWHR